jgi:hydroxymethylglutaryl-CoA lyase
MEKQVVSTEQKIAWAEALLGSWVDILQLGSFVHPEKVPQMADTDRLFAHFTAPGRKPENVVLSGLVLNEKGLERGLACGVEMFCMGVSASETHSRKNTGMGIKDANRRIIAIAEAALAAGRRVQVSVQSAFGCGYEGPVPKDRVVAIVKTFLDAGLRNLSLADTAGHATPYQVEGLYSRLRALDEGVEWTCHFHNTYGLALANCYAAYRAGVRYFESSVAGLGGCPFTKVAGGNTCTEDLVGMLEEMGVSTGIDIVKMLEVGRRAEEIVDPPAGVETVADLVAWLKRRGPEYAEAFARPGVVRAAVDKAHVQPSATIVGAREIAFFPPVTGG